MDFTKKFDLERIGIAKIAERQPDKPALIMNEVKVTFRKLNEETNALAHAFLEMAITPGDRICMLFYNSPEIMKTWTAAGKISVTPIALNYRFKADELAFIINDSQSRLLIYSAEFDAVVEAAKPKFTDTSVRFIRWGKEPPPGVLSLDELIKKAPDTPPRVQSEAHGVASSLIYTSGTTGRPKGVVRGIKNRLNSLLGYAYTFESTYDDTHLVAGPLYHSAPYAWAAFSLLLGNTVVIMPGFDAENFLRLTDQHKATTVWVVPTMLNRILNLPDKIKNQYDTSSLRVMTVGGESFPFPLKKRAVEFFGEGRIFEFFGATEISCVTCMRPEDQT
jgi:fatty-acyl-CoA synthase/long-chain acyl-CoA synthetase